MNKFERIYIRLLELLANMRKLPTKEQQELPTVDEE
jgi:hypothetical protein